MYKVQVAPEIKEQFPYYKLAVVYARGLKNKPSNDYSSQFLAKAEQEQYKQISYDSSVLSDHPHIKAWRRTYSQFGAKPKKYPCSVEALLKRVCKGDSLPRINYLVDIYNALSIKYVMPFGGEDLDQLTSDLSLKFATGDEEFKQLSRAEEYNDPPKPGEVIYEDSTSVTCRRWNWRQSYRTAITEKTTNAFFVIDILPPFSQSRLEQAVSELVLELKILSPEVVVEYQII